MPAANVLMMQGMQNAPCKGFLRHEAEYVCNSQILIPTIVEHLPSACLTASEDLQGAVRSNSKTSTEDIMDIINVRSGGRPNASIHNLWDLTAGFDQ